MYFFMMLWKMVDIVYVLFVVLFGLVFWGCWLMLEWILVLWLFGIMWLFKVDMELCFDWICLLKLDCMLKFRVI